MKQKIPFNNKELKITKQTTFLDFKSSKNEQDNQFSNTKEIEINTKNKSIINDDDKSHIRLIHKGKNIREISELLNISIYDAWKYSNLSNANKNIKESVFYQIRQDIKQGMSKNDAALKYRLSIRNIYQITSDLRSKSKTTKDEIKQMRELAKQGMMKKVIAKKFNVSYDTVLRKTRGIKKSKYITIPEETIKKIRKKVIELNSKTEVAKIFSLKPSQVKYITKDIKIKRGLKGSEPHKVRKIREGIKEGNTKKELAKIYDVSYHFVCKYTKDMSYHPKRPDISYQAIELLNKILNEGHAFSTDNKLYRYRELRKKFNNIRKVSYGGKTIYFFDHTANDAAKAFINSLKHKPSSYQDLNRILILFDTKFKKKKGKNLM
jgi:transposase